LRRVSRTAGIAGDGAGDALDVLENALDAPETSAGDVATSDVAGPVAGSASAGAGIARAPSAADDETRSAMPAVSRSAAAMMSVRKGPDPLLKLGLSIGCDIRRLRLA